MNLPKQLLLNAYYYASLAQRNIAQRRRCAQGNEPVRILYYHRVADNHPNPWTMSRQAFAQQIDWITQHYEVLSLGEVQHRLQSGVNHHPAVAITFDDGYADNCDYALPMLQERGLPVTYFVTTGNVLQQNPFSHDVKRGIPLAPNTPEQIIALAEAGVEIGAHTRTHANLGIVSSDQLADEIVGSKNDLETMVGREVRYFAFPFGLHANMTVEGFRIAYQAGFKGVCSAYGGYNFPLLPDNTSPEKAFHLQRIHADPERVRLKNWLTVDPRKLKAIEPFELGEWRRCLDEAASLATPDAKSALPFLSTGIDSIVMNPSSAEGV